MTALPIFAYGTLQPGEHYWPLVAHLIARVEPARTRGYTLYHLPEGYPCVVPGEGELLGTLLWVEEGKELAALAVCDEIEGFFEGEEGSLYIRARCVTDGGQEAWIYLYGPSRRGRLATEGILVDGPDWMVWRAGR
jgi:gamma-glutamylcyclotransferase (GGCT)/AIG2-like uncharacterized protein YtfP